MERKTEINKQISQESKVIKNLELEALINKRIANKEIAAIIFKTILQSPAETEHVLRVLKDESIGIQIVTSLQALELLGHIEAGAFFIPNKGTMYFIGDSKNYECTNITIIHEFTHADAYLRNRVFTDNRLDEQKSVFPVLPTKQNIENYAKALQTGLARIREFYNMYNSYREGKLPLEQHEQLSIYCECIGHCLPRIGRAAITEDLQVGDKIGLDIMQDGKVQLSFEALSIKNFNSNKIVFFSITKPYNIFYTLSVIDNINKASHYKKVGSIGQTAEVDAHCMEILSKNAKEVFFSEAYQMRELAIDDYKNLNKFNTSNKTYNDLLAYAEELKKNFKNDLMYKYYENFANGISTKNFGLSLRNACAIGQYHLVDIILNYVQDNVFDFDIEETTSSGKTALQLAMASTIEPEEKKFISDRFKTYENNKANKNFVETLERTKAITLFSTGPRTNYDQAVKLLKEKKYNEAIEYLNTAIGQYQQLTNKDYESSMCYSALATCYRDTDNLNMALECCQKALEACPIDNKGERMKIEKKLTDLILKKEATSSQSEAQQPKK